MEIPKIERPQLKLEIGLRDQRWRGTCPLCGEILQLPRDIVFQDAISQQAKLTADFDRHIVSKHGLGNRLFEKK